jgi:hypothetical protein
LSDDTNLIRAQMLERRGGIMLFYLQMRWNIEGRATLDEVFAVQEEESSSAGSSRAWSPCTRSLPSAA